MALLLLTDKVRYMAETQGPQFFVESPTVREGLSRRQQRPHSTRSRIRVRPNTSSPYEMVSHDQSVESVWGLQGNHVRRLSDSGGGEIPYSSSCSRSRGEGGWQVKFYEGNRRTRTLELASTALNYDDEDSPNSDHHEGDDVLPLLEQGRRREHHDAEWKDSKDNGLEGRESGVWCGSDSMTVGSWEQQPGNSQLRRSGVGHSDRENINSTELSITCSSSADPLITSAQASATSPSPIECIGRDNDHADQTSIMEAAGEAKDVSMYTPRTAPSAAAVKRHHRHSLSMHHHAEDAKHAAGGVVESAGEIIATTDATAGEFDSRMNPIAESYERGRWLLGLLVLQSSSSFVLNNYQGLLRDHVVVTLFLTMLVGAGGNAGNQSAIKVIRGLATGRFTADSACASRVIGQQALVGLVLGTALSAGGFVRVWVTDNTTFRDALAISMSLFFIVMTSVLLGSALPFGFARTGVDPAHAGTSIQVAMDIIGVAITCVTCSMVLTQLDGALSVPGGAL